MISNMHCRTVYPTNKSTYSSSSFLFVHSDYTNTLNPYKRSSSSYHDQILPPPPPPPSPPPSPPQRRRRRRRRLEDPVITYASNYYVTYSRQTSHSPPPPSPPSPHLPSYHQTYQQSNSKDMYCDLFNLLECPPPVKPRRKYILSDYNLRRRHRSIDYKNSYTKLNSSNAQKQQQPQASSYNEKNHHEDKVRTIQQSDRMQDKTKTNNCIYQRTSSSKGFFRRVACNYFCMPMTVTNREISN